MYFFFIFTVLVAQTSSTLLSPFREDTTRRVLTHGGVSVWVGLDSGVIWIVTEERVILPKCPPCLRIDLMTYSLSEARHLSSIFRQSSLLPLS